MLGALAVGSSDCEPGLMPGFGLGDSSLPPKNGLFLAPKKHILQGAPSELTSLLE